jgi:ATP/maltotriose-dependent transcriptional regulator MalT
VRAEELAARYGQAEVFATCRVHYGELLVWRGAWGRAEAELVVACRELAAVRGKALDGPVRLAELRRRQGRIDDAAALVAEAADHLLAPVVRAAIALDEGDPAAAADEAERFLRRVGEGDRLERVPGLELLVRARLALDEPEAARLAAEELDATADRVATRPLRAAALLARGRVSVVTAPEDAPAPLEDAADLLRESGVHPEAAVARLELARALRALGRDEAASRAEAAAREELAALGLAVPPAPTGRAAGLTRREREVLRLVAQGRSNEEIAAELVLSVRTVESHVASLYRKVGISGRTARAAATAYALANGLA